MSSSPTQSKSSPGLSARAKKVIVPKVWKRPHSQIYGKNVEYGSSLYSDKIGEINGRKFNSDLPWHVRNSGGSLGSSAGSTSQGYISERLLTNPESTLIGSVLATPAAGRARFDPTAAAGPTAPLSVANCASYAQALELTNPNRYSRRRQRQQQERAQRAAAAAGGARRAPPIDFYERYMDFSGEIERQNRRSLLLNEPLLRQKTFSNFLDFDYELGLFVPSFQSERSGASGGGGAPAGHWRDDGRCLIGKRTNKFEPYERVDADSFRAADAAATVQTTNRDPPSPTFVPLCTTTKRTHLLPAHDCSLASSPYGQSADGRKLSLGSINPHSYRPSLPSKTTTVHASDGEEFDLQDRSSPFFTDRWAGKTIRHFDSDLYSNANLFKTMIL